MSDTLKASSIWTEVKLSRSVQSHPLNDGVKGVLEAVSFLLLHGEHHFELDLVEEARALRVRQDYLHSRLLLLEVGRHSRNRPTSASPTHKRINLPVCLPVNLRPSGGKVHCPILQVLELVGIVGILALWVLLGQVAEVVAVDDGNWRHFDNVGLEGLQQRVLVWG